MTGEAVTDMDLLGPQPDLDLDAFYRGIAEAPDDRVARAAFADWLEERAGTEVCERCGGRGSFDGGEEHEDIAGLLVQCPACSGTGRVPDRYARLAAGYRALGEFGRVARYFTSSKDYGWTRSAVRHHSDYLQGAWWDRLGTGAVLEGKFVRTWSTRRTAEDAAALAWSAMTDGERETCRRELK